jgi:hypothetical protein
MPQSIASLQLEVAKTPADIEHGLMFRHKLASDSGMLFRFAGPVEAMFWGKNTYIPLDVAFIDRNDRVINVQHIVPLSTRRVASHSICVSAIEANAGFFKDNGIGPGTKVNIAGNDDSCEASFYKE